MAAVLPDSVRYLERYGYLPAGRPLAPDSTALALARFQARLNLPVTGLDDETTRAALRLDRCGMPDQADGLALRVTCTWGSGELRYAFGTPCGDYEGAFGAVERAISTWAAVLPLKLERVGAGDNPDVLVEWRPAQDPDHSMVGKVLAHADFPGSCWSIAENPPKPLHFDDSEHIWVDGAIRGAFDVETVALHEFGHLLGLTHTTVAGAVMYPAIAGHSTLRELQPDDLERLRALYPLRSSCES
ncbi:matrixin family metalloprotease [Kineosporia sp. NBRC 101731]|uniref:matrixin family metalloprotease n=1 Tax=Kineosporia sp. NBRC 101731 TaxID=3032199 RepID=UPI0024A30B29|nr:matrixin family metalloprotease [Kineosporia sp. NBRC 101731]GLY31485.1 hypothetical protein Kisp02_48500 [Kineosporia sp. NBRC 101731]